MPREKLSDGLSEWMAQINEYLAQYKDSYNVQRQLVEIRQAMENLRDFLMTGEGEQEA